MLIYTLKTQWKDGIDDDCQITLFNNYEKALNAYNEAVANATTDQDMWPRRLTWVDGVPNEDYELLSAACPNEYTDKEELSRYLYNCWDDTNFYTIDLLICMTCCVRSNRFLLQFYPPRCGMAWTGLRHAFAPASRRLSYLGASK